MRALRQRADICIPMGKVVPRWDTQKRPASLEGTRTPLDRYIIISSSLQFVICLNYTEELLNLQQRHQNNCQSDDGSGTGEQYNDLFHQRRIHLLWQLTAVDGLHIVIIPIITIVRRLAHWY